MSDTKSNLQRALDGLKDVEERARKLKNQNLADVAKSAHGKISQLSEHPDLGLLDEPESAGEQPPATKEEAIARTHASGSVDPEGLARVTWPHLFETPPFAPEGQPAPHTGL